MKDRTRIIRNVAQLILLLSSGWQTYESIIAEIGWAQEKGRQRSKTAYRNISALEQAGLPIEYSHDPETKSGGIRRFRLSPDWVARCKWLKKKCNT